MLLLLALLHFSRSPVWEQQVRTLAVSLITTPLPDSAHLPSSPTAHPARAPLAPKASAQAAPSPLQEAIRTEPTPEAEMPAAAPPVETQVWAPTPPKGAPVGLTLSTPAQRQPLTATAANYLVTPPAEVPRLSKRAGESGTVWLRVVVDAAGLPVKVSLHRSSGYPRLDEQALWAMRQARFKPHTENGRALEVDLIAPIEYPAD